MRRAVIVTLAVLAALLVASQFLLPRYLEGRIEERMERGGGSADASISAFPALRLLAHEGRRLELSGNGLQYDLTQQQRVFKDLDGFDEVSILVEDSRVGPIMLDSLLLERDGDDEPYEVELSGTVSGRDLAAYMGERFGGPLGGFIGALGGNAFFLARAPVPFEATAEIESEDGQARTTATQGTVAGFPAGPIAEIVAAAVVARL